MNSQSKEKINSNSPAAPIILPNYVLSLMERLEQAGEEVYLVGGSLRDILLGLSPHDYDLATSAPPQRTAELFCDKRVIQTGLKHGTITVLSEGNPIEITTFRIDGTYSDSRHPDQVIFTSRISDDLARRDFTVNALAYHPQKGLIDLFGGEADLQKKQLRAVGDPNERFEEDALRIMRAFRFSAQLGFFIEEHTLDGCKKNKSRLTDIAKERIASEFLRLLLSKDPSPTVKKMMETGVLSYVCDEYAPSEKILKSISKMPAQDVARLGFFFADASKEKAAALMRDLRYSNKQITGALSVVSNSKLLIATPTEARQLIARSGIYAPLAARASYLLGYSEIEACEWVEENRCPCTLSELAVSGRDLVSIGISGRNVGRVLEWLLQSVIEDPSRNEKQRLIALCQEKKGQTQAFEKGE